MLDTPLPVAVPVWKDILIRAGKTFIQGATGAVGATFFLTDLPAAKAFLISAAIGGTSAVLSAAWNFAVQWSNS